jgi:hypothetical protein
MSYELRTRNQSQQLYTRALSQVYRNNIQTHDPSVWLLRDPEIEEKMLRDADIAHAVGYRRHLIAGRDWQVVASRPGHPRAEIAQMVGEELLGFIKHFTQARLNLARAFFSGARYGRIHGAMRTLTIGDGKPRQWWCPVRIEDVDKRIYRQVPKNEYVDGEHKLSATWERWNVAASIWEPETVRDSINTIRHVYQDDQATLGYGRALREALGWWWYAKTHVFEESLQSVERFSQGMLTAKIDGLRDAATGLPNEELAASWIALLEQMRSRHVMVFDKSDEVTHVEMTGTGWELQKTMREELKNSIFTLVLGANLTTSASEGGSYALAEVQENSTEALIQFDRQSLEETMTDDLLGCIWFHNHANLTELGINDQKPRFSVTQEKKSDPKERADVAAVLNGMGVSLSREELLEQTGFKSPDPDEEVVEGTAAPSMDPMGAMGGFPQPQPQPQPQPPAQ